MRSSSRSQKQVRLTLGWLFWQIEDGKRPHGKLRSKLMGLVCWRLGQHFQHGRSAWIEADRKEWKDYPNASCGY